MSRATQNTNNTEHEHTQTQWIRTGGFNHNYDPLGIGSRMRAIFYRNTHRDALIDQFELLRYESGNFQLVVKAKNPQTYERLQQAMVAAGFPEPDLTDQIMKIIRLHIEGDQRHLATLFLQQVDSTEPLFATIKAEICQHLNIDLTQQHQMPLWIRTGDFNRSYDPGTGSRIRSIFYRNAHRDALVDKFQLLGYEGGSFQLVVNAKNPQTYERLQQAIVAAGFPEPAFTDQIMKIIRLCSNEQRRLIEFIETLSQTEIFLSSIKEEIIEMIRRMPVEPGSRNGMERRGGRLSLFIEEIEEILFGRGGQQQPNGAEPQLADTIQRSLFDSRVSRTVVMPEQGKNAQALKRLDVNAVPEHLCCPLSGEIMDNPVCDPAYPQYTFERMWIEERLKDKEENPFTRTALTKDQLISDQRIKSEIKLFMKYARNETFCGLKPGFLK